MATNPSDILRFTDDLLAASGQSSQAPATSAPGKVTKTQKVTSSRSPEERVRAQVKAIEKAVSSARRLMKDLRTRPRGEEATSMAKSLESSLVSTRIAIDGCRPTEISDIVYLAELDAELTMLTEEATPLITEHSGRLTHIALVDAGPACEQPGVADAHPGDCWLTPRKRDLLILALDTASDTAFGNYRDAIQDARIDELTASEEGMGFLLDLALSFSMGLVAGAVAKGLASVKTQIAAGQLGSLDMLRGEEVSALQGLIGSISDGSIEKVVGHANAYGHKQAEKAVKGEGTSHRGKAQFLQILRAGLKSAQDQIVLQAPTQLTDAELTALTLDFADAEAHSVTSYATAIAATLKRYDQQQIGLAGVKDRKVVRLRAGSETRLAMVLIRSHSSFVPTTLKNPEFMYFENFIDDDLGGVAQATYSANADDGILEVDVVAEPDRIRQDERSIVPDRNFDTWVKKATKGDDADE